MNSILRRRRGMMGAQSKLPPIPAGYVTDGLVFFLDGLQLANANNWTDIVGGKKFTLYNCSVANSNNGIVFDGTTSYGETSGAITNDFANETIEVVASYFPNSTALLFSQPVVNGNVGIGIAFSNSSSGGKVAVAIGHDGVKRNGRSATNATSDQRSKKVLGINGSRLIIRKTNMTGTYETTWAGYETGVTTLGCRCNDSRGNKYTGTVYAVRIYNRKLSEAEIGQNQDMDIVRYGI